MEIDMDEASPKDKSSSSETLSQEDEQFSDVPVPPDPWKIGLSPERAEAIILKFANKRSLIKSSVAEDSKINMQRVKVPRMKMYADEEEEKQKRAVRRSNLYSSANPGSIHSRLGTKCSYYEHREFGTDFSSGSGDEDDYNIPKYSQPRYNIWTDEDRSMPRRSKASYYRPSEDKSSQDLRSLLGSRSSSSYNPYRRSDRGEQSRSTSRDLQSASGTSFSRRFESSVKDENDLRSSIKSIKDDDKVGKHRSPLFKYD